MWRMGAELTRRHVLMVCGAALAGCATPAERLVVSDGILHSRPRQPAAPSTFRGLRRIGLSGNRDGMLYVPKSMKSDGAPLILWLHGAGGAGSWAIERLIGYAGRTGVIVLAPDSRDRTWGVITDDEAADVAFLDEALDLVFREYAIDPRRIVIGGFSDGASAALSWGLINGDLFSSIAAFSPGFIRLASQPRGKPRVFVSHGKRDQILPIDKCGRRIARGLQQAEYQVRYEEFDGDHAIPDYVRDLGLGWAIE